MFKIFASGIIGFALTIIMCCCGLVAPANAACDKAQAQEDLAFIEQGAAKRYYDQQSPLVWYEWQDGWDEMTPGQKRRLVMGIGGLEKCLTGKEVRIRYAGKDVGYFTVTGEVEIYD